MGWLFGFDKEETEDRSHQDNFLFSDIDGEKWDNGNYQYCDFCGKDQPFEWGRCSCCHNN